LTPKQNALEVIRHGTPEWVPTPKEAIRGIAHRDARFYNRNGDPTATEWTDAWGVGFEAESLDPIVDGYPKHHPLTDLDRLDEFSWPDPNDPELMDVAREGLAKIDRDRYLVNAVNPGSMFVRGWLLMGMEEFLVRVLTDADRIHELLDRICDYQVAIARRYCELRPDMATLGDDAGTNLALMMRPELWRELIKPRMKRVYDVYKDAGCIAMLHCCGRIMEIVDDIIEIGIDVLNPIQASANDLEELRARTAGKLTLLGGIDCRVVATGTPEEVASLTEETIRILGSDGEYFAWPDQTLRFPEENLEALEATVRRVGRYPTGRKT
jgi:uroporphyrinogen decarboxylase